MWRAIRRWGYLLATDAGTTKIELVCGRLCRGRDCHTWHAANAIADAAVSILEAGRTRLQEYMRDAGFTDFSTAAWRCAIGAPLLCTRVPLSACLYSRSLARMAHAVRYVASRHDTPHGMAWHAPKCL